MRLSPAAIGWILGINTALALAFGWSVYADARRNRRPAIPWLIGSCVIGIAFGAPNGFLCYYAFHQAIERGARPPVVWAVLCAVLSVPAYIAFYTYDDCRCRSMNRFVWPTLALVLALPALVPWLLFQILYLLFRPPVKSATIDVASIKKRHEAQAPPDRADAPLVRVEHLKCYFPVRQGIFSRVKAYVKAVDDVSLFIRPHETLGLVGESGCGKTTLGRAMLRLIPSSDGRVIFDGLPLDQLSTSELRVMRKEMQVIFQDPFGSLNPRMNIENTIGEPMTVHKLAESEARRERVAQLLERVGLSAEHMDRYPHEFSGGQRQRIGIARALATEPRFIICDEPVSALDVSIQAQIINLLKGLQKELGLSYLFIAHDLRVVESFSDRVAVMYLGKIVELASSEEIYHSTRHPYSVALMSAIPIPDPTHKRKRILLPGDVPSPIDPPPGCSFHPRCFNALPVCSVVVPPLLEHIPGHFFACHNPVDKK